MAIIGYYIGLLEVPRKLVFSLAHAHVGDYYMDVRSFCFQWWWLKTLDSVVQWNNIIFKFPKCIFANNMCTFLVFHVFSSIENIAHLVIMVAGPLEPGADAQFLDIFR